MKEKILIGSYTKKDSKGIYEITLDTEAKTLENLRVVAEIENPTYLALSKDNRFLFSVSRVNEEGGTSAFAKQADGTYKFINAVTSPGAPPCYIGVDQNDHFVFSPNYHKGTMDVLEIHEDGHLSLTDVVKHEGKGPNEARQDGPHTHYGDLTPDGKYVVVCDLGTDEVYTYAVNATGQLTKAAVYKATPGQGPRHLVFHPNGKLAYLFTELSSEVVVLSYNAETGEFTEVQTVPTLPADFDGTSIGAAIRISKDGKFVYASNRGHESLAVFAVATDGTLSLVQHISVEGKHPRDFDLDPTNQFVVVANQETDNLTLFERNAETGKLTLLQKDVYAPEAVCVTFSTEK